MSYDLSDTKILIVDDMPPMLMLVTSLLGHFGFRNIQTARNGEEAFSLFRQNNHDIVITDWLMEPMDGLELVKNIRKSKSSPNPFVPVLLMTGYSSQPRVESARDLGVTEFLMKPFSARDMYARIVQMIEKPRQYVEVGEFFGPCRRRRKNFEFRGKNKRSHEDAAITGQNFDSIFAPNDDDSEVLLTLQEITKNI